MPLIDAGVYPYPAGPASQRRLAFELKELGFTGMVAIGGEYREEQDFITYAGMLVPARSRDLHKQAARAGQTGGRTIFMVSAGENNRNRAVLTTPGVHMLTGIEQAPKDAFDRHCASLAAEREVAVDISIRPLIYTSGVHRQKIIRRFEEIITLQQRYGFLLTISSGAGSPVDLRAPKAIAALFRIISDDGELVSESFSSIERLRKRTGPVREMN